MKRNLKFTFRANVDAIVAYEFYESRRKNLGERFLDELKNYYKSIVLNYTTYKVVHKIYRQAVVKKFPFVILNSVDEKYIISTAIFNTSKNPDEKFK
ncbi:type II toxin-antitoxin system RelE/ParE family toxin [Flavobacterium cellulosilyticum]|uniref:Type II toxin-antitoxin system RelE/ParE family toxin n=1 Tax=Flavobacterium cellulosilyticum TaxID=2541731 RepID=A0A4R5CEG0_9FLAO|nr:type II toxin-antitoxin system RelE/ParE family toxin [Flavobacterium cellulosilyticum]TDD97359.1 type II toxin-antitoxin system RelE/ParE family toxin [Flavobacterium cellulosilyticum]